MTGTKIILTGYSATDMDEESQRTVAAWAVFVLPLVIFAGFLYVEKELPIDFIGLYWFPAIVLTIIGSIPPLWELFVNT